MDAGRFPKRSERNGWTAAATSGWVAGVDRVVVENRSSSRPHLLASVPGAPRTGPARTSNRGTPRSVPRGCSHIPCVRHRSNHPALRAPTFRHPTRAGAAFLPPWPDDLPTGDPRGVAGEDEPRRPAANALHGCSVCAGAGRAAAGTARGSPLRSRSSAIGTGFPVTDAASDTIAITGIAPGGDLHSRSSPPRVPALLDAFRQFLDPLLEGEDLLGQALESPSLPGSGVPATPVGSL